jgi:threonine/homoserine/homoserine lactone efflux protein
LALLRRRQIELLVDGRRLHSVIGLQSYIAFLGVSLLVICTPGQDTALTIRNTLSGGRPGGVATALGVSAGQATWTVATSAGLAVVLIASGPLFLAIRLGGAAYLVYLGVRSLLKAASHIEPNSASSSRTATRLSPAAAFWQGLLSNMSNAKMVAFFISLLPPFAGPRPSFVVLLALGLNFSLLTLAWLVGYTYAIHRVSHLLGRTSIRRGLDAVLGAVLVGLGIRLAAEAR